MGNGIGLRGMWVLLCCLMLCGCEKENNLKPQNTTKSMTVQSMEEVTPPVITLSAQKEMEVRREQYMEGECWVFYAPDCQAKLSFYDEREQCILEQEICTEQEVFIEAPAGCTSFCLAMEPAALKEAVFLKQSPGLLLVSKQESAGFGTISEAVQSIEHTGTILIFPGIYQEQVCALGKNISFIGVNRDLCILESCSSDYYSPPLELCAGEVKNMTIRAVDRNSGASRLYAYGVHADDNRMENQSLRFENCNISSDFNSAVGMGLRKGCQVELEHCILSGKEYGLFCHDTPYSQYAGQQRLTLRNCTITGNEGAYAMCIDSQGLAGSRVELLFLENTFLNPNHSQDTSLILARNHNGTGTEENWMGLKGVYLLQESKYNNIPECNK